jgi:hypothetical protein
MGGYYHCCRMVFPCEFFPRAIDHGEGAIIFIHVSSVLVCSVLLSFSNIGPRPLPATLPSNPESLLWQLASSGLNVFLVPTTSSELVASFMPLCSCVVKFPLFVAGIRAEGLWDPARRVRLLGVSLLAPNHVDEFGLGVLRFVFNV